MMYQSPPPMKRYWTDVKGTFNGSPFEFFTLWLQELSISTAEALEYFTIDYAHAVTLYSTETLITLFSKVAMVNRVKYNKLISVIKADYNPLDNYNMTETSTDTRTPDLTATSTGTSTATGTVKNNQVRTTTDNPDGFTEKSIRSVNPYDTTGMRDESQNVTIQTGTRETIESYSGNGDTTDSTSTANSTTTQTGTEKVEHTLARKGNIGVTTSQQMLQAELLLAEKMNIFRVIEKDIAEQIFLKVW